MGCDGPAGDAPPPLPPGDQPNVVWVLLDAARAENFTWYGYERETTPYIDELAEQGVAFYRHYAQAPATLFSVSSYLSGRYFATSYHDDVGMQSAFRVRPDSERLVSELASDNGYHTAAFSTSPWFYETSPLAKTFDEFVVCRSADGGMEPLDAVAARVETWLDAKPDGPFLLYVHAMDTHFPHAVNEDVMRWYSNSVSEARAKELRGGKALPPYDDDDREYLRAVYDGALRRADAATERLCRALQDAGEWDRTIFIISSDHGELLGEDGKTLQHPIGETRHTLYHTPLVIRAPGIAPGTRVDVLTENVDIVPTIADLASWKVDGEFDGSSLRPAWSGEVWTPRPFAIARALCFAPMGAPTMILFDKAHAYEFALCSGEETVRAIGGDLEPPAPSDAATARAYLDSQVLPRWTAFEALPKTAPPMQQRPFPASATPKDAYTDTHDAGDGKWMLAGGTVREGGPREEAAPIFFVLRVHAGHYRVTIEADAASGDPSSILFREDTQSEFKTISIDENGEAFAGEYALGADVFRFAIDDVPNSAPITLNAIRFERVSADSTGEDILPAAERLELLKSLGYVD